MQIELIATASEDSAYLPRLGLGALAALTPKTDEVIYTDDLVKPFDIERDVKDVDLVGISVDSKTASRSYAIAQAYRQRGVKVVLGGIHPTALPDEALSFADAVVVSEAEDLWPQVVEDARNRRLQRIYRGQLPDLARTGRPFARRDLFRSKKYVPLNGTSGHETSKSRSPSASKSIGIGHAHKPTPRSTVRPGWLYATRSNPAAGAASARPTNSGTAGLFTILSLIRFANRGASPGDRYPFVVPGRPPAVGIFCKSAHLPGRLRAVICDPRVAISGRRR